jgi:hypothetical protein
MKRSLAGVDPHLDHLVLLGAKRAVGRLVWSFGHVGGVRRHALCERAVTVQGAVVGIETVQEVRSRNRGVPSTTTGPVARPGVLRPVAFGFLFPVPVTRPVAVGVLVPVTLGTVLGPPTVLGPVAVLGPVLGVAVAFPGTRPVALGLVVALGPVTVVLFGVGLVTLRLVTLGVGLVAVLGLVVVLGPVAVLGPVTLGLVTRSAVLGVLVALGVGLVPRLALIQKPSHRRWITG